MITKNIFLFFSGVNCYNQISENTPFGGYKQSGNGRENSVYALDNYTQIKAVKINIGL